MICEHIDSINVRVILHRHFSAYHETVHEELSHAQEVYKFTV